MGDAANVDDVAAGVNDVDSVGEADADLSSTGHVATFNALM